MDLVYEGASIECEGAKIISRSIVQGALVNIPSIGLCRKLKCERNSESTIEKELTPKQPRISQTSHLDFDTTIKGDSIVVYLQSLTKCDVKKIALTGRHNAQLTNSQCFTYAEITVIFPNLRQIRDPKQVPPNPPHQLFRENI